MTATNAADADGPSAGNDARWREIMNIAEQSSSLMASRFVAQIADINGYGNGGITEDELRETARMSFEGLAASIRIGALTPDLLTLADHVGSSRARAGISAESLARAARLDFSILWDHLLEICGPPDASLLATHVRIVWQVIDEYVRILNASYSEETVRLARSERVYRQEFVSRLFGRAGHSTEVVRSAAAALKLDPLEEFTLAASTDQHSAEFISQLSVGARERRVHFYERDGMAYAFWQSSRRDHGGLRTSVPDPADVTAVAGIVRHIDGLRSLAPAAVTAAALARVALGSDELPLDMDRGWVRLAREKVRDAGLDLAADADQRLATLREGERERIEETVREYLVTGSISAVASRLHCHRNTVLSRLNYFKEVTGIDLRVPKEAARLVIGWL